MAFAHNLSLCFLFFLIIAGTSSGYQCDVVGICLYEPGDPPPPTKIYVGLFAWNLSLPSWPSTSVVYGDLTNIDAGSNWYSNSGYSDSGYYYTQQLDHPYPTWRIISSSLTGDDYRDITATDYTRASSTCFGSDSLGEAFVLANVSNIPAILRVNIFKKEIATIILDKSVLDEVGPITESKYTNPYNYCGFAKVGTIIGGVKMSHSAFYFQSKSKKMLFFYDTFNGQKIASLKLPSFSESRSFTVTRPVIDSARNLLLLQYSTSLGFLVSVISTIDGSVKKERKILTTPNNNNLIPWFDASINEQNHLYYYGASLVGHDAFSYGFVIDYLNESRHEVNLYLDPRKWGSSSSGGMASGSLHSFAACNF